MHKTKTYQSWDNMKARCFCKTNAKYPDYGARGITVCDRWLDFRNFLLDMGAAPEGHTIERIDVNGNYEPGNCKWITKAMQAQNKRRSVVVEVDGEMVCLREACRRKAMNYRTVLSRINILGQTPEEAMRLSQNVPRDRRRRQCSGISL